MANVYALTSRWEINTGRDELWDVLEQLLATTDPMPWWRSVQVVDNDGTVMNLKASSQLGYTLHFRLYELVARRPDTLTFASDGDLRGSGTMTFRSVSADASALEFQWNVSADRAWMRATSLVLRPLFVLGHHLVMAEGEKNLNAWLAKRGRA